jgi:hypothetical protein
MDDMKKINSQQAIRPLTDPELKVFLKFHHAVGTILYFGPVWSLVLTNI